MDSKQHQREILLKPADKVLHFFPTEGEAKEQVSNGAEKCLNLRRETYVYLDLWEFAHRALCSDGRGRDEVWDLRRDAFLVSDKMLPLGVPFSLSTDAACDQGSTLSFAFKDH